MEIEEFSVPYNLEDLVKTDSETENIKKELKKYTRSKCLQIFHDNGAYNFIAWAVDQIKANDTISLPIAEILEELCNEATDKLKHFFKSQDRDSEDISNLVSYKKAACLVLLYLKTTLKTSKSNIMKAEDSKKLKNRLNDPILMKQLNFLVFFSRTIDLYGNQSEMFDPELGLHILDITFRFMKCSILNDGIAIENISKIIKNLLIFQLIKSQEFNSRLFNLLEDGTEEGGNFMGKIIASLLTNAKENLAELAHETIMRIIELLMSKKFTESPLYKNSRELLMEVVNCEPLHFYNNFGIFVILLGCENYGIRTFVCEGMLRSSMFLRERAFTDSAIREKILKFFEIVCERSRDKSSFARSAILNCISSYINLGLLDDDAFDEIFSIACERITDSSSIVRKRALILLQELCLYFRPKIPTIEQLEKDSSKYAMDINKIKNEDNNSEIIIENSNNFVEEEINSKSKSKHSKVIAELNKNNEKLEYDGDLMVGSKSKKRPRKNIMNQVESSALKNINILEERIEEKSENHFISEESISLNPNINNNKNQICTKLIFYQKVYNYLFQALSNLRILIFSRNSSDTIESLRLIYIFTQMEIKQAKNLFFETFKLIWIKEPQIKDELIQIFHRVFINKFPADQVIENLISVFKECDQNARISLEEIINQLYKRDCEEREGKANYGINKLQISIKKNLWETFLQIYTQEDRQDKSIILLKLLKLCVNHYPQWITENIESIFGIVKDMMSSNFCNFEILAEFSSIIMNLVSENCELKDVVVKSFIYFVLKYQGISDPFYPHFLEKVIYIIFSFKKNPEVVCDYVIKRLTSFITKESFKTYSQPMFENVDRYFNIPLSQVVNNSQGGEMDNILQRNKLIHLVLAVGHVALKFLFYFEKIDGILQNRRSNIQNNQVQNELEQAIGGADAEYENQKEVLASLINTKIFKDSLLSSFIPLFLFIIKSELEQAEKGNHKDNTFSQQSKIHFGSQPAPKFDASQNIKYDNQSYQSQHYSRQTENFPNRNPINFSQQINNAHSQNNETLVLMKNQTGQFDSINLLSVAALDALSKYMMISSALCFEHLDLIFQIIETPQINSGFASNAIIYLGDLFHKHPNILSPHMGKLFNCLKSKSSSIRRTAITVLSHLILNDFVKLKAEIADFVFLLDDEDSQIIEIANLFFHQLSEKDAKFIYNILPDAISRLSLPEEQNGVSEIQFEKFAKYFFKFIQKEKVVENLIEKLILRIKGKENDKEIRNIIYCIFCLVNNDKGLQKLNENVETIKLVIDIRDVSHILKNLIFRLRKNAKINKGFLDELESILFQSTEAVFTELKKRKQDKQGRKRGRRANNKE